MFYRPGATRRSSSETEAGTKYARTGPGPEQFEDEPSRKEGADTHTCRNNAPSTSTDRSPEAVIYHEPLLHQSPSSDAIISHQPLLPPPSQPTLHPLLKLT